MKHILRLRRFALPDTFYTQSRSGRKGLGLALRRNPSLVSPVEDKPRG